MTWSAIDIAAGAALGLGEAAVAVALGSRLRRLARWPAGGTLAVAADLSVGSFGLAVAVFALGRVGLLAAPGLIAVTLAAAAVGRWRAVARAARRAAVPLIACVPLLAVALAPPFFYDARVYHLGLPWQALLEGRWSAHPETVFASFPPLARYLYAIPLTLGAERAPAVVHLVTAALAAAAAAGFARRLGAPRWAAAGVSVAVPYLALAPLVPAFPAAESWTLAGVLGALALAFTGGRRVAIVAGALAGVAVAARLQGIPWAAIVLAVVAVRHRSVRATASAGVGVAVASSPWWAVNALLGGRPWDPIGAHRPGIETLWRDGASLLNLATGPADLVAAVARALATHGALLGTLLIAGVAAATAARSRRVAGTVLAGVAGSAAWALGGALGRFLVPAAAVLLVAAVSGRRRFGAAIAAVALLATIPPGAWSSWKVFEALGGARLLGESDAVLASVSVNDPFAGFAACAALPEDARVLIVAEPRGLGFPRRFVAPSQHDPSPLAAVLGREGTAEDAARALRDLGFTHLLIHVPELQRLSPDYPVAPWSDASGRGRFVALTRYLGEPVVAMGGVVVYRLDPGGEGPVARSASAPRRRRRLANASVASPSRISSTNGMRSGSATSARNRSARRPTSHGKRSPDAQRVTQPDTVTPDVDMRTS